MEEGEGGWRRGFGLSARELKMESRQKNEWMGRLRRTKTNGGMISRRVQGAWSGCDAVIFLALLVMIGVNHALAGGHRDSPQVQILRVGEPLEKESLKLNGGTRIYEVVGLQPARSYEIKVSYPASVPATFKLQFLKRAPNGNVEGEDKATELHRLGRRLLDTEKIIFFVDKEKELHEGGNHGISYIKEDGILVAAKFSVTARSRAVSPSRLHNDKAVVVYNIECEALRLNLPVSSWRVIAIGVFCIMAVAITFLAIPQHWLPSFLQARQLFGKTAAPGGDRKEKPYGREARAALERRSRVPH